VFPYRSRYLVIAELGNPLLHLLLSLLSGELLGPVLERLLLPLLLALLSVTVVVLLEGILANGRMRCSVHLLQAVRLNIVVDVLLELALVPLLIIIRQRLHVLGNVATENVLLQDVGVELLGLGVEAGESVLRVGDEDTAIRSTLHGAENTSTSGRPVETNIEIGLEGAAITFASLGDISQSELSIRLLNTLEVLVQTKLLENTAGDQEASAVSGSPVSQTMIDAVGPQLVGVRSAEHFVARDLRGDHLHGNIAVGEPDDKSVLGRIVLVLGLGNEPLAGEVVGLTLASSLVFGLEATVVGAVLDQFGERLVKSIESAIGASETLLPPKHLALTLARN